MMENTDLRSLVFATRAGKDLSEYQIKLLEKRGISTVEDFVALKKLDEILDITECKVVQMKKELLDQVLPRTTMKSVWQAQPFNYLTGIEALDRLLESIGQPLRPGRVWEIVGSSDTGKTQLMHAIAANFVCQHRSKHKVLFVDTNGDFNEQRVVEILQQRKLGPEDIRSHVDTIEVMKRATAEELVAALNTLVDKLSSPNNKCDTKLVLIDSLTVCFWLYRSTYDRNKGRAFVNEVASLMRKLAVRHGLAFILSNTTLGEYENSDDDEELQKRTKWAAPTQEESTGLGQYWSSVCTLTLALELPKNYVDLDGIRLVKVLSNYFGNDEDNCLLRITDAGVISA